MTIKESCFLNSSTFATKNSDEPKLWSNSKPVESHFNKIFEAFCNSIDFLPLVNFINEEDAEFEALLLNAEQKNAHNSNHKSLISPQRKIGYNLRYNPYRSFQKKPNCSLEEEKQQVLALIRSGVGKTTIEKEHGIRSRTLKEWCRLNPWHSWK